MSQKKPQVIPVPGPNAALTALAASGLPTHQFIYLGFLPKKTAQVRKTFLAWSSFEGSMIVYESKYKIEKSSEHPDGEFMEKRDISAWLEN